jgi:hypothetical protein
MYTPHDPKLPFDQVVKDIKRVHRSRRTDRTARHSRPRALSSLERARRRWWVLGTLVVLAVGVLIAVLATT